METEEHSIREVALGGPDTATRAQVVWQIGVTDKLPDGKPIPANVTCEKLNEWWDERGWVTDNGWQPANRGRLRAKAKEDPEEDTDPCIASPEARYRGAENQLYRVEIHTGGQLESGKPTFKWSRENGSVVLPIEDIYHDKATATMRVTLGHLGRDDRFSLRAGDWVEIVDDDYSLQRRAEPLLKVASIDPAEMQVTLELEGVHDSLVEHDASKHPLLRRWDHKEGDPEMRGLQLEQGGARIKEGKGNAGWLALEDGIQIQFHESDGASESPKYRTGDFWLIPARTATGDVEWPKDTDEKNNDQPHALPPHGVEHHYAPLAIIPELGDPVDCRRKITQIAKCA